MEYTVRLNSEHIAVIREACDLLARVSTGQWQAIEQKLPFDVGRFPSEQWNDAKKVINELMRGVLKDGADGFTRSLSVVSNKVRPGARIAFDIFNQLNPEHDGFNVSDAQPIVMFRELEKEPGETV